MKPKRKAKPFGVDLWVTVAVHVPRADPSPEAVWRAIQAQTRRSMIGWATCGTQGVPPGNKCSYCGLLDSSRTRKG